MTYYEELGVLPAASVAEIRAAYKRLARLLHPDKSRDEKSRIVAECQMKRLNGLYKTLTDPKLRRMYNLSVEPAPPVPVKLEAMPLEEPVVGWTHWGWWLSRLSGPNTAWIGAGLIVVLMMLWTLTDTSARMVQPRSPDPSAKELNASVPSLSLAFAPARPNEQSEIHIARQRRRIEEIGAERDAAVAQVNALERKLEAMSRQNAGAGFSVPTPVPITLPDPKPPSMPNWTPPARHDLIGTWYYAISPPKAAGRDLYPPEYIEAVIREESGYLLGRYRARYRVADRTISPDVIFQFSGRNAGPESALLPWLGAGGSRGEVRLKLITRNTLEIAWIASDLGKMGLGSGTAVLVRRNEQ